MKSETEKYRSAVHSFIDFLSFIYKLEYTNTFRYSKGFNRVHKSDFFTYTMKILSEVERTNNE